MLNRSISIPGVFSVWERHASIWLNSWKMNLFYPIYEPILSLFAFGYGLGPLIGSLTYNNRGLSYIEYIAPGLVGVACMVQSLSEAAYPGFISVHHSGLWQARLTSSLSFDDVFFGDVAWATTRGFVVGNIVGGLAVCIGVIPEAALLAMQPILLLSAILSSALGFAIVGISSHIDHVNQILHFLLTPMYIICGTYFPRSNLPDFINFVAGLLPLGVMLDLLRCYIDNTNLELKILWLASLAILFLMVSRKLMYRSVFLK